MKKLVDGLEVDLTDEDVAQRAVDAEEWANRARPTSRDLVAEIDALKAEIEKLRGNK